MQTRLKWSHVPMGFWEKAITAGQPERTLCCMSLLSRYSNIGNIVQKTCLANSTIRQIGGTVSDGRCQRTAMAASEMFLTNSLAVVFFCKTWLWKSHKLQLNIALCLKYDGGHYPIASIEITLNDWSNQLLYMEWDRSPLFSQQSVLGWIR